MGVGRSGRRRIGTREGTARACPCVLAVVLAALACKTEELPSICPDVGVGELVITEIRGQQGDVEPTGDSSSGTGDETTTGSLDVDTTAGTPLGTPDRGRHWVELTNVTDRTIDLEGLVLDQAAANGGDRVSMRIRDTREVASGAAYVLGLVLDRDKAPFVDYGVELDWPGTGGGHDANLYPSGRLDVVACGERIDLVEYAALPEDGTRSLGTQPPNADANDVPSAWCTDTVISVIANMQEPGTPGEANRPCE